MKRIALVFLFAAASTVAAELIVAPVIYEARHPGGAVIQLHDVEGPCAGGARLATFNSADGSYKVNGCHKLNADGATVGIAWLDGDGSTIPLQVFRPPVSL